MPPGGWQQPLAQPALWSGRLASWGSRLAAYAIDSLIIMVPFVVVLLAMISGGALAFGTGSDVGVFSIIATVFLLMLVLFVLFLIYAPLLMMRSGPHNGQTWGKQMMGITVVRDNGQPFGFGSAALREVVFKDLCVWIASTIIPFIPWFLNYFWPLWDDQNRALHDMAASTHVVRT